MHAVAFSRVRIVVFLLLFLFVVAFLLAAVLAVGTMNERGIRKLVTLAFVLVAIYFAQNRIKRS